MFMFQFFKRVISFLANFLYDFVPPFLLYILIAAVVGYYEYEPLTFANVVPFIGISCYMLGYFDAKDNTKSS